MKRVRFVPSPLKVYCNMDDLDCHTPRPYLRTELKNTADVRKICDPVELFDCSNSCTYTAPSKFDVGQSNLKDNLNNSGINPSLSLELSLIDSATLQEPRKPVSQKYYPFSPSCVTTENKNQTQCISETPRLDCVENIPQPTARDNSFFITRDTVSKVHQNSGNLPFHFQRLNIEKEVNNYDTPKARDVMFRDNGCCNVASMNIVAHNTEYKSHNQLCYMPPNIDCVCLCVCCKKVPKMRTQEQCSCVLKTSHFPPSCICKNIASCADEKTTAQPIYENQTTPKWTVDKKTLAVEKYESRLKNNCSEIAKPTAVIKEKRESTVADLFKIIKLQNEQLQLLQEKVDKFICSSDNRTHLKSQETPVQITEQLTFETVQDDQHKISIGVMTSFEMIRTSTVVNKDLRKHATVKNAQVHCNLSQANIKTNKTSEAKPSTVNFLEGIQPVDRRNHKDDPVMVCNSMYESDASQCQDTGQTVTNCEEKTYNDQSLYNIQVDNATTPLLSPDQTLYLDVRDYSDSDTGSDDQSHVGWTYYNKVMTHVNGMLQDSELPSSASALCRNTRQHFVQMQIDKTNISVTKRVMFGEDVQDPVPTTIGGTDTSIKMNQLAAKYLKRGFNQLSHPAKPVSKGNTDMSMATRNYMERHQILPGLSKSQPQFEMPRFLDVTALKQQPKLL